MEAVRAQKAAEAATILHDLSSGSPLCSVIERLVELGAPPALRSINRVVGTATVLDQLRALVADWLKQRRWWARSGGRSASTPGGGGDHVESASARRDAPTNTRRAGGSAYGRGIRAAYWNANPTRACERVQGNMLHIEYPGHTHDPIPYQLQMRCVDAWARGMRHSLWRDQCCAVCDRSTAEQHDWFTVKDDIAPLLVEDVLVHADATHTRVAIRKWPTTCYGGEREWTQSEVAKAIRSTMGPWFRVERVSITWETVVLSESGGGVPMGDDDRRRWVAGDGRVATSIVGPGARVGGLATSSRVCVFETPSNVDHNTASGLANALGGLNLRRGGDVLLATLRVPTESNPKPYTAWGGYQLSASGIDPRDAEDMGIIGCVEGRAACRLAVCQECAKNVFGSPARVPPHALCNNNNPCVQVLAEHAFSFNVSRPSSAEGMQEWYRARTEFMRCAYALEAPESLRMLGLPRLTHVETFLLGGTFMSSHFTVFRLAYRAGGKRGGAGVWPVTRMKGNHMVFSLNPGPADAIGQQFNMLGLPDVFAIAFIGVVASMDKLCSDLESLYIDRVDLPMVRKRVMYRWITYGHHFDVPTIGGRYRTSTNWDDDAGI